jgi:DNA polymerase-3 subunit chi
MTKRADFYYITGEDNLHFACRVLEKAYQNKHQVYVHVATELDAQKLNELLWTFQQGSFIPHAIASTYEQDPPPIEIGFGAKYQLPKHRDIVMNLASQADIAKATVEFDRVIEIIAGDKALQTLSEKNKSFYQQHDVEIKEHQIS